MKRIAVWKTIWKRFFLAKVVTKIPPFFVNRLFSLVVVMYSCQCTQPYEELKSISELPTILPIHINRSNPSVQITLPTSFDFNDFSTIVIVCVGIDHRNVL